MTDLLTEPLLIAMIPLMFFVAGLALIALVLLYSYVRDSS
jgi:hypothetical protein